MKLESAPTFLLEVGGIFFNQPLGEEARCPDGQSRKLPGESWQSEGMNGVTDCTLELQWEG